MMAPPRVARGLNMERSANVSTWPPSAVVAPVGTAFARCHAEFPAIPLDASDHHHATEEGYYLAALVIFETIYHESATNAPSDFFNGVVDISPNEAAELQHVADEVSAN